MSKPSPLRLVLALVAVAIGVAAVISGEADDSPGLQGLGIILAVSVLWWALRSPQRR